ncbi:hypothetical protein Leryth_008321 [Lithospermum erythrorhizon]|uniref:CRIB domain-containing protein n=1 Tax=Lithospermum erythrorhizon TaxID=34254 RepID=A0AAV3R4M2_LITER|nr:hypothetical protein Leryth_008321 [Lithospermum erythrorhizon]
MGLRKGFNKFITQIFVVKENEIQIGCPTDVKHVAHIGFDAAPGTSPSWMGKFETGPNFALSSIGASGSSLQPLSSKDLESKGQQSKTSEVVGKEASSTEVIPPRPKKLRRKKKKSETTSSTRHDDGVKTRSSTRRSKLIEGNVNPNIKVS